MKRAVWTLAVLLSHWRRHPLQLATLLVGLISAVRRVLVMTAEFGEARERTEAAHLYFAVELGVLTALILALALALVLLKRKAGPVVAEQA